MGEKTKIDERREREEYDRQNPWRPMSEAVPRGQVCELLFHDLETSRDKLFFLHSDGRWYALQDDGRIGHSRRIINWRPVEGRTVGFNKRENIVEAAKKRGW
jgi:hypothetical protein